MFMRSFIEFYISKRCTRQQIQYADSEGRAHLGTDSAVSHRKDSSCCRVIFVI